MTMWMSRTESQRGKVEVLRKRAQTTLVTAPAQSALVVSDLPFQGRDG